MPCLECGSPLIDCPGGSVCSSNRCTSKVVSRGSPRQRRHDHAVLSCSAKPCRLDPKSSGWMVEGDDRRFYLVKNIDRVLNAWPAEVPVRDVIAMNGTMPVWLRCIK